MGSLYIAGGITKHAEITGDWDEFDKLELQLSKLAKEFNVYVQRCNVDYEPHFVISSSPLYSECFYEGTSFEYDMSICEDETFDDRANQFIEALEYREDFYLFHKLSWSAVSNRYYVHT